MSFNVWAQMEERGLTRTGNELVNDSLFVQAEAEYLKSIDALDFDTNRFNMAFAMMGQEKFDEAIDEWKAVAKSSENKTLQSLCHYNIGGIQVMKKENDKAIESYKQALRFQPKNELARHNYWFLKMVKDQNPQQDQNQDQNSDDSQDGENSDDSKDQQNKENSDKEKSDKEKSDKEKSDDEDSEKDDDADKSNEDEDADKSNEDEDADKSNEEDDANKSNEEDDANKSNEDEDAEKSNEDEDAEKSNEDEDADKSNEDEDAEKSNEDEESKDNQNGESDDESNGEEGEESAGEQPVEGELSKGDAIRLLESLDKEEDKTQKKIKLKLLKGKNNKTNEKDW